MGKLSFAVALLSLICSSYAFVSYHSLAQEEWETFKLKHGKQYNSEVEEKFRMKIFLDNKMEIARHNQLYHQGLKSFTLGINKYSDMLPSEFVAQMNGLKINEHRRSDNAATFIRPYNVTLPKEINWAEKGAVTPIKDQGQCGSCFAFSATGSLEGQHFRKTGKLVSLSEQQIVDCDDTDGGCNGGLMDNVFEYIQNNKGIDTEESYPYMAKAGNCHFNPKNIGADDKGLVDIHPTEDALKEAVATIGPISVGIDAGHDSFQAYSGGIYEEPDCSPKQIDHGVLVVGYGTTQDGVDYWIIKNSWGTSWGEKGYFRMKRNAGNMCGVASCASYPLV